MIKRLDNAVLLNDLDANAQRILNAGEESIFEGSGLLVSSDQRLADQRLILDGSVSNASVAGDAGIDQSKLLLDGDLPANYLGTAKQKAAKGSLYQPVADKGAPEGYAPLDGDGRLPAGNYPFSSGGTVNEIRFSMPEDDFTVATPVVTLDGSLEALWNSKPGPCWFGVPPTSELSGAVPRFNFTPIDPDMVPALDVSKIESGMFHVEQLPAALGVGAEHALGVVPDTGETGDPGDYLARDMTYRRFRRSVSYQPNLSKPVVNIVFYSGGNAYLSIISLSGAKLFYRVDFDGTFAPVAGSIVVPTGSIVEAYAAKPGYNTSDFTQFTIPTIS